MLKKRIEKIRLVWEREAKCLADNRAAADARNRSVLRVMLAGAAVIFTVLLLTSLFYPPYFYLRAAYALMLLLVAGLALLLKYARRLRVTVCVYLVFAAFVGYCSFTSAFVSPGYISVTILAALFQVSVLYVEQSRHIVLATVLGAAAYLTVVLPRKNAALRGDEAVNVCVFALFALIIGSYMRRAQLENMEMRRQLQIIAYTDQLTGLANRRSFFEALERQGGEPVSALAMLDIDDFKFYNDRWGHQAGDECLRRIGSCLKGYEREGELRFYRYGGEEFVAAARGMGESELLSLCGAIGAHIARLHLESKGADLGPASVSVGVAGRAAGEPLPCEALLGRADIALYAAKERGKNRALAWDASLERELAQQVTPSFRTARRD